MNANTHGRGKELTERELQNVVGGMLLLPQVPPIWKPTPTFPVPPTRFPGEPVPTPWW
jgi:bacteriocin-like protein